MGQGSHPCLQISFYKMCCFIKSIKSGSFKTQAPPNVQLDWKIIDLGEIEDLQNEKVNLGHTTIKEIEIYMHSP